MEVRAVLRKTTKRRASLKALSNALMRLPFPIKKRRPDHRDRGGAF
jgi:hypothetical protein